MPKVTWDQEKVEASRPRSFDNLPRGKYPCIINDSVEKKTKAGDGKYWEFEFEVVKGDFQKRKLWARLNIENPSEVAQRIGREQFKALCVAAGKPDAKTSEALHGKHVVALVSIEQNAERGPQNRVDGFQSPAEWKEEGGVTPSKSAAASQAAESEGAGAPKGKGAAKGKSGDFDDDIPF